MTKRDWKKEREIKGELIEWENQKTGESIKVRMRGGTDNSVSILGKGRYQPEYLAGGNSKVRDISKSQALILAHNYMRTH